MSKKYVIFFEINNMKKNKDVKCPTCMKVYDIDEAKTKRELRKQKLNKIFKDEDVS